MNKENGNLRNFTAIILAGGESRRMKRDKKFLEIQGQNLLDICINRLEKLFGEVIISVGKNNSFNYGGKKIVNDILPGRGPIMGIYSALKKSGTNKNFIIAVDIPEIDTSLINLMAKYTDKFEIVVPVNFDGKYEPLFGFYSKTLIPQLDDFLRGESNKIIDFYQSVKIKTIPLQKEYKIDNLNTVKDFQRYLDKGKNSEKKG